MYIKKIILLFLAFVTVSVSYAQRSETRQLRSFNQVVSYDGVSVQLVPSDTNSVKISGLSPGKVVTQVSGNTLKLKINFGSNFKADDNQIIVYYAQNLDEIKATEGSYITSNKKVNSNKTIVIKSIEGADVNLEVEAESVSLRIATGAKIKMAGKSENITVNINTGGRFDGEKIKSKYGEVKIATGGEAKVNVSEVLDASVTMGGAIYYFGEVKTVNENISLGGRIEAW